MVTEDVFYERKSWPVGTVVRHPDNPDLLGNIVKRGGQQWTTRDRLPWVRWHGKLDAEQVPWERLIRG